MPRLISLEWNISLSGHAYTVLLQISPKFRYMDFMSLGREFYHALFFYIYIYINIGLLGRICAYLQADRGWL